MRRVLVPVDGSKGSIKAAEFAANLVREAGGQIVLVYVYDMPAATAMGLTAPMQAQLDDTKARIAQAAFDSAKKAMGGVEVAEHLVEIGHPAEQIVEAAKQHGATQIVMGSRGLSPIKELLLGSVSERVVRSAHCPVTIAR
jgi:nucleotide-binding universal stress UspA family protein